MDGTLQARAGNSADQSLLLAYVIKSAGYDARIVRGELAIADQQRLLGKTSAPDHDDSLNYLTATVQQQFETLSPTTPIVPNWQETDLYKRTEQLTELLWSTLVKAGADLDASDSTEDLLAAGEEYFWVQYREGPSQHWQSTHPAFGSTAFTEPAAENFFTDALPDDYLHKLTISAWVE